MRRAALAILAMLAAGPALAEITGARFAAPTDRYRHGVFGETTEYGALELTLGDGGARRITLPGSRVFEDTSPRLADIDGDGEAEVIVVETDISRGARLSIYDADGLVAATPFIGRTRRWLAPVGAADLDGDGAVELAYVETPHLGRTLRVWRFADGALRHVDDLTGLTNHRFGAPEIAGGIRECGTGPEIVTANGDFSAVMATRLTEGRLVTRRIAPHDGAGALAAQMTCPEG